MSTVKPSRKAKHLDAIIDQLMSTGLNGFSLRELAAQTGTSHRVLIYHFVSKENLVNEVVREVRRREREHFVAEGPLGIPDLARALNAFFAHNISEEMRPYFRLFYEVWGIAQSNPESYQPFLEGIVSVWVDSLSEIFLRAGYDSDAAKSRATLVLGALRGLQLDLFATGEEERVTAAFQSLVELFTAESHEISNGRRAPSGSITTDNQHKK